MPNCPLTLLAILAHPDDETYRCGGTLALLARRGVRVSVLCATRGEVGIPGTGPEQAGQVRQAELECACRALGVEPPRFLGYRDDTLAQVDEGEAVAGVLRALRDLRPQVLLTWPPDGVSGHPDHVAVSRWASRAFEQAADVVAMYHIVVPESVAGALGMAHLHTVADREVSLAVDAGPAWEQKLAAIHCHRSQASSSPIVAAPEARQRLFLGREHFRRAAARDRHDLMLQLQEE